MAKWTIGKKDCQERKLFRNGECVGRFAFERWQTKAGADSGGWVEFHNGAKVVLDYFAYYADVRRYILEGGLEDHYPFSSGIAS